VISATTEAIFVLRNHGCTMLKYKNVTDENTDSTASNSKIGLTRNPPLSVRGRIASSSKRRSMAVRLC
jgi:hypothetical protein